MTVIQDLPAELLRRILELMSHREPYYPSPARDLSNTSLVARAWRRPSQDLLISAVVFHSSDAPTYSNQTRRLISSGTLNCARLEGYPRGREVLERLTEAEATVRSLLILANGNELNLGTMRFEMLAGVHWLHIRSYVKGEPPVPSNATIELKTLSLVVAYLPSPAFLELLVGAAPSLTRLEVYMFPGVEEEFPEAYNTALQTLAPQLRHLCIHVDASSTPAGPRTVDLHGFVASCASLRSLELYYATPESIAATLAAVRSPLVLLATELDDEWSRVADAKRVAELVDVLKHPLLGQLKRWRI